MADSIRLLIDIAAVLLFSGLLLSDPEQRDRLAIATLSMLWVTVGVLVLDTVAASTGWWTYYEGWPTLAHSPVDVLMTWVLLWGAIPVLTSDRIRPVAWVIAFAVVDLSVLPALLDGNVLDLGRDWWIGELLHLTLVAFPALTLARLTHEQRNRATRVALQVILFASLTAVLLPVLAVHLSGVALATPTRGWVGWALIAQIAVIPLALAMAGVVDLHKIGRGTPYPWDATSRIVSTGPYAYVRNPLQVAASVLILTSAVTLRHLPTLLAGTFTIAFSLTVAALHEHGDLVRRWGEDWVRYRDSHRDWLPTWRPRTEGTAVLYIDETCEMCTTIGDFIEAHEPVGLAIAPASSFPGPHLMRATYVVDGYECDGVEAAARAVEHIHLGWAVLAWIVRLPGVVQLAQVVADAVGFGPRPAGSPTCSTECEPAAS